MVISVLIVIPRIVGIDQITDWALLKHFAYIFTLNFIYWYFAQFIIRKNWKIIPSIAIYFLVTGFFSIIYNVIINHFFFNFKLLDRNFPIVEELNKQYENIILFFRGILFSGIIYIINFYLKLLIDKQKINLEIELLKKEKLEAQLSSLKQQISPHFLFNSLSTLRTMVEDKKAEDFINNLSKVYRYLLRLNESDLVSLAEELDFTKSYIHILKERFEDALMVDIALSNEIKNNKIPPVVLQLLIENAIKHNIASAKNPLFITINYSENKIVVRNNIQPKISAEKSTEKGLKNIKERYKIISNEDVIIEKDDLYFTVKLPIL